MRTRNDYVKNVALDPKLFLDRGLAESTCIAEDEMRSKLYYDCLNNKCN